MLKRARKTTCVDSKFVHLTKMQITARFRLLTIILQSQNGFTSGAKELLKVLKTPALRWWTIQMHPPSMWWTKMNTKVWPNTVLKWYWTNKVLMNLKMTLTFQISWLNLLLVFYMFHISVQIGWEIQDISIGKVTKVLCYAPLQFWTTFIRLSILTGFRNKLGYTVYWRW